MKTILVATDLSSRSENALRRAFKLADQHGAALTVLSIVDSDLPADVAGALQQSVERKVREQCAAISGSACEVAVELGDPMLKIHEAADARDVDVIVLGLHRVRPIADLIKGTTMERLVRASRRPVLLVRDSADHPYANPVCGVDLSPSCAAAAQMAARLAPEATIHMVHAVHVPFRSFAGIGAGGVAPEPFIAAAREPLQAWAASAELPAQCAETEIVVGSVPQAMMTVMGEVSGDLLVIGAHGRPIFAPSRLGSIAEEVLRHPPCDVLVVRR